MDKIYYNSIDETAYHTILENGLNVYIIKKEGFNNKSAYFATKFGSFNTGDTIVSANKEEKLLGGLAHFLEHRVFDYKDGNIMDLYYKLGADVNAYTSYDRTVYYFNTVDNFDECLRLLLDFPTSFTMSEEKVENEKDIIVSELLMYKDDPNDKVYRALMNALYKEHPVKYDVGGEPEEVRNTTRDLLEGVHSTFYNPKNMYLVIVGDVDIENTMKIVREKEFKESIYNHKKLIINEEENVVEESVVVEGDVNNKKMLIGYKLKPISNLDKDESSRIFLSFDLLTSMLFSSSSEFYKKMIDEKYVSYLGNDILEYDGLFSIIVEADLLKDENEILNEIQNQFDKALNIITQEKLDSIKRKNISRIIKGSDSCSGLAKNYITYVLDGMDYGTLIDLIKSINLKDIENAYNSYYKESKRSYAILRRKEND